MHLLIMQRWQIPTIFSLWLVSCCWIWILICWHCFLSWLKPVMETGFSGTEMIYSIYGVGDIVAKLIANNKPIFWFKQGLVKGEKFCFRNLYFYFWHRESTSTASQLTSPASQKSKGLNKVLLLLQDLGFKCCFFLIQLLLIIATDIKH